MIAPATAVAISQRKNSCADEGGLRERDPRDRLACSFQCGDPRFEFAIIVAL